MNLMMSAKEQEEIQDVTEVIQDVADDFGWSPRRVIRLYRRGNARVVQAVDGQAQAVGVKIDPEKFKRIIEFLFKLFALLAPLFL